jgi:hypothetical protein
MNTSSGNSFYPITRTELPAAAAPAIRADSKNPEHRIRHTWPKGNTCRVRLEVVHDCITIIIQISGVRAALPIAENSGSVSAYSCTPKYETL